MVDRRRGRSKTCEATEPSTIPIKSEQIPPPRQQRQSGIGSLFSNRTLVVLCVGILTGYVILPMLLVEINMDRYMNKQDGDSEAYGQGLRSLAPPDIQQRLVEDQKVLSRQSLPTSTTPVAMETKILSDHKRKKILVTGGAGFVGSHLVDKLMMEGHEVIVVDNFFTGQKKNIAHWLHHPNFR